MAGVVLEGCEQKKPTLWGRRLFLNTYPTNKRYNYTVAENKMLCFWTLIRLIPSSYSF